MKQPFYILIFLAFPFGAFAQSQAKVTTDYINKYKGIAISEMNRTGIPASITLAQAIVESGSGESNLAKQANNHFGIKCKTEWTGEKMYKDDDMKNECFRVYENADSSFIDHSNFLKYRPYYASLFELDPVDDTAWAYGLKKAGYATEKDYANRLIKIINDFNLQQFSISSTASTKKTDEPPVKNNSNEIPKSDVAITIVDYPAIATAKKDTIIAVEKEEPTDTMIAIIEAQIVDTVVQKKSKYVDGIFTINHSKVFYAKEGTSLLSIANKYGITLSKLLSFNDMKEIDILNSDTLIFIESKLKKGGSDFHVVNEDETLQNISQTEGVQLSSLLQYNALKLSIVLKKDEKIYLRPRTTKSSK